MFQGSPNLNAVRLAVPIMACFFIISCGGSNDTPQPLPVVPSTTDGQTTAGTTTAGTTTAGTTTAGTTTAGTTTAGTTTAGTTTAGTTTAGTTTAGGNPEPVACSVNDVNRWVLETMTENYLFTAQIPDVNPDGFFTNELLVDRLTVSQDNTTRIFDTPGSVSNPTPAGSSFGYGFRRLELTIDNLPTFQQLSFNSPARNAEIKRGDVVVAVNGTPGDQLTANDWALWRQFLYTDDATTIPEFTIRTGDAEPRTFRLQRAEYINRSLGNSRTSYTRSDQTSVVALLPVESFSEETEGALDAYARWFTEREADELIIDLRYNTGGRVSAAKKLASQVAGNGAAGNPYSMYDYNANFEDEVLYLTEQAESLGLQRVIILTTETTTAAASTLIASLAKVVEVITIGQPTRARDSSYITRTYEYCDRSLKLVVANQLGGNGESVLAPIPVTCAVVDTWNHPATSSFDALIDAGLSYAFSSNCPVARESERYNELVNYVPSERAKTVANSGQTTHNDAE